MLDGKRFAESPWIPGVVLALGLASVALLVFSDQIRQRSAVEDAFSLRTCEQIRADIAISHLWLEEYVSGDQVDLEEIQPRLVSAIERLDQMAGSVSLADSQPGALTSPPLHDADLRRRAATIRPIFENFRTLSEERQQGFSLALPVGIGSALDVEYDRVFNDLLHTMQSLAVDLQNHNQQHRVQSLRLFWTIVILWSLLVSLAAIGLWVRQRRQQRAEQALLESRAQLTHSQRMDAAGRLAGGLAHDLSNYLAAIRGHCELARLKSARGQDLMDKMDEVIQTVDRASDLVDRLSAFGRRQPMRPKAVDLHQVLQGINDLLVPSMGDKVRLEVELTDTVWPVFLDRTGIEHALVNLLINARDAMPQGGVVQLAAHNRPPTGAISQPEVEVTVRDQGVGIAAADLDKIFDPFWTTKRASGGSGLGLSMVYAFVEQSRGRLTVESEVGSGTTFHLFFPQAEALSEALPDATTCDISTPVAAMTATTVTATDLASLSSENLAEDDLQHLTDDELEGDETLLLVDDNVELRDSTRAVLEALGYRVHSAADGQQAMQLDHQHVVDLWIIDLVLPDIDGRQLLRQLRQRAGERRVPAILISGHSRRDLETDGDPLPPEDDPTTLFLAKHDLSAFRLAQRIRQCVDLAPK